MGLFNNMFHSALQREAAEIASWAVENFNKAHREHPDWTQRQILSYLLTDDPNMRTVTPPTLASKLTACSETMHGLCYTVAIYFRGLKGAMPSRVLQFTKYMDQELERCGLPAQPHSTKVRILKALNLYEDNWEQWCQ